MFAVFSFIFTFWFWIDLVFFVLLLTCVVNERPGFGLLSFIAFLTATHFLTDFNVIEFMKTNTKEIVIGILSYLPIGIVWAYTKWFLKIKEGTRKLIDEKEGYPKSQLRDARVDWVRDQKHINYSEVRRLSDAELLKYIDPENKEVEKEIQLKVDEAWASHVKSATLRASEFKESIINWIAWWPFSMFWVLVDDFFRWCGRQIYNLVAGSFQRMSESQFKGI